MTCGRCGLPVYWAPRCGTRCRLPECVKAGRLLHVWDGTPPDHPAVRSNPTEG